MSPYPHGTRQRLAIMAASYEDSRARIIGNSRALHATSCPESSSAALRWSYVQASGMALPRLTWLRYCGLRDDPWPVQACGNNY
jgi:hypothetical protein